MIFPAPVDGSVAQIADESVKRSFVFDFKARKFVIADGQVQETTDMEAVQQWLELLLRTTLDKYMVYRGSGFGTTVENYIGYRTLPFGFVESELEREITQAALSLNPAIDSVGDFVVERRTRGLTVSFSVTLKNGQTTGVMIDGVV